MNLITKWILTVFSFGLALIPLWVWLLIYKLTEPTGFWQKFALVGVGVWFFGIAQIICLFIWVFVALVVIWDA